MPPHRIISFGELLLRCSASSDQFINQENISVFPGGSEANVAASLAQWGLPCSYLSCVPDNDLARQALSCLNQLGVETGKCMKQGDRLGLYFLLSANGLSKGEVVYDRKYSAFSQLQPGTIDWDTLLDDHSWFHFTALTPALNEHLAAVCEEAVAAAKAKGLTISVDLNYRSRLWQYGRQPDEVMPQLVRYADVVMGNIWAANNMLGIPVDDSLGRQTSAEEYIRHAAVSAQALFAAYPQAKHIAYTFRFMDSPRHNLLYGTYHTRETNYASTIHETFDVVDRIGSGDAFMAGLIFALCSGKTGQDIVETATSAGFKKLFVKGDFGDGTL
jgi:2-dehydro-3-deoxygluconokinase